MKLTIACHLFLIMSSLSRGVQAQVYLEDIMRSPEWIFCATESDSSHVHFIKNTCIRTSKSNLIKVWLLIYHESFRFEQFTYKGVSEKVLTLIDFENEQMKSLAVFYYDSGGHLLYSEQEDHLNSAWDPVVPDSMGEGDFNKAKKLFYHRKEKH